MKTITRFEVEVPAGTYWIGDPCYVITPDSDWQNLLKSCDYFNAPVGQLNGHQVLAFRTQHGDGVYYDKHDRFSFMVDAGIIGLTPFDLVDAELFEELDSDCLVEFSEPTICSSLNGVLKFGDIEIDTN